MNDPLFQELEERLQADGGDPLEILAELLRRDDRLDELFETRLMRQRRELGLSPLDRRPLHEYPAAIRERVREGFATAAREVGELHLGAGRIGRAWPFFKTIDEPARVVEAVDALTVEAVSGLDEEEWEGLVKVAFNDGVHPRPIFSLVLARGGTCDAITLLEGRAAVGREDRQACGAELLRHFYRELQTMLRRAVEAREAEDPGDMSVAELLAGRDWLFDERACHVDDSHLQAVLRIAATLPGDAAAELALALADYGARLPQELQVREEPPFQDFYRDYRAFFGALRGRDVDATVARFTEKAEAAPPDARGVHFAAEILILLLSRVGRPLEAVSAHGRFLGAAPGPHRAAPTLLELCRAAGDPSPALELARQRGDVLSFAAALDAGG